MKILHLSTFQSGGAAVAAQRIQKSLHKKGIQSTILVDHSTTLTKDIQSISNTPLQRGWMWIRFIAERLSFYPFEKSKEVRYAFSPAKFGTDLSQNPLVVEADLIHIHWINFGFLSINTLERLFRTGKPIVWTCHDMWAFTGGCHHSGTCEGYQNQCGDCKFVRTPRTNDLSHTTWLHKQEIYQKSPFTVVTCSKWLRARAESSSLLHGFRITDIPNPIDTDLFYPLKKKAQAKLALHLPTDKAFILFAAVNVQAIGKGYIYFKDAIERFVQEHPALAKNVELLVMGKSDIDLSTDLSLPVNYVGYVSDITKINLVYNAASVFVIPSLEENLPNTIMESMACGTPVVGFNTGGIPEMIDHQVNGYVADYLSVESLMKGIVASLEAPSDWALRARQKVVETYAEEVVANSYIKLYTSILPTE